LHPFDNFYFVIIKTIKITIAIGIEIEYITNITDFLNKSVVIDTINCDGAIESREYNTANDLLNHIDTEDEELAFTAPMLDDEIASITIDEMKINI